MDSSNVKHRARDDPTITTSSSSTDGDTATAGVHDDGDAQEKARRQRRMASAKRGLRSLSIAVAIPFSLTLLSICLFGTSFTSAREPTKAWAPPLLALHLVCLASASVMGLSAWIVWAEGGFHRDPSALLAYVTLLALGLAWDPIVFWLGADWTGLAVATAAAGAVVRCRAVARRVNSMAADLVMLCLAWAGFLAFVNVRLVLASDH